MNQNAVLNREFWSDIKKLVIPSFFQMLINNSFSFVDTIMISGMGDNAVAAVAAGGQFSFILGMILSAVYGISAYITQFYGKKDYENIYKALGVMGVSAVSVSFLGFVLTNCFKREILSLFIKDEKVIAWGMEYLGCVSFVYIINAIKDSYKTALDAIGKIKINLYIGFVGMLCNTFLNYILIYGKLGAPKLGIKGAAAATVISGLLTAIILISYIYKNGYYVNAGLKQMFSFDLCFVQKIYKKTIPLMMHEGIWSVGNMLYAVAFGHMGVAALSSYQMASTFQGYFMMGVHGFAYAARVMIGKKLSQESPEQAILYAKKITKVCIVSALILSGIILIASPFIVKLFYNLSPEVKKIFYHLLLIQSVVLLANFMNNIWIVGVFRTGGDNLFTMKMIAITTWGIGVPLVFLGADIFSWPVEAVYVCFSLEEVTKAVVGYFRFRSNKWANNLVKDMLEEKKAYN